ncbi:MAG: rod shape-determining protein MreD [Acetobacteraceae bacterium]|nr:rod shape-determining protein MreD [Acetobacteraceae bacterium]
MTPRASLLQRLDRAARAALPSMLAVLLLVLSAVPLGLPGLRGLAPAFAVPIVYFWSIWRPALVPPATVFAIGVLADLLGAAPLGVSSLTLLLLAGLVDANRRMLARQSALAGWLLFVPFSALTLALTWALTSLLSFWPMPAEPVLLQWALTVGLYPALAFVMGRADRWLAALEG